MEQGLSWHEAAKRAGLQISQSTAYRLRQRMREGGKQAALGRQAWTPSQTARRGPTVVGRDLSAGSSHAKPQASGADCRAVCPPYQYQPTQSGSCRLGHQQSAPICEKKVSNSLREQEWQEGAGALLSTFCCERQRPAFPVGKSFATEATACNRPRACAATSLPTAVEALAHPPVSQCGWTAATLGLTHLHRNRTREAFGKVAALQLSSRRTFSENIGDRQC
jgi:hypothetical protein